MPSAGPKAGTAPRGEDIRRAVGLGEEDYTRKYSEDEYGAEMGPDARAWRTYISERDIAERLKLAKILCILQPIRLPTHL